MLGDISIVHRQLLAFLEEKDLLNDFEFDVEIDIAIANPHFRHAYVSEDTEEDHVL